ncbi:hypothetical protein GCM10028801_30930 [Nocardioides maradonensis]
MSDEEQVEYETPNQAVSRVVQAGVDQWLQGLGGGFATAFTVCIEYVDPEGRHCWAIGGAPSQTPSQTLGLLRWHQMFAESDIETYFAAFDEYAGDDDGDEGDEDE